VAVAREAEERMATATRAKDWANFMVVFLVGEVFFLWLDSILKEIAPTLFVRYAELSISCWIQKYGANTESHP
jgi:hypothetical protein